MLSEVAKCDHFIRSYVQVAIMINFVITAQMCSKVLEAISASKTVRSEIKTVISSAQNAKNEAHRKISTAVTKTVEDQNLYKVSSLV